MPYSSACAKPVGFAIGADDDDARREVGVGRCVEQGPKIGARARDEDGDREHRPSLPAAAGWACGAPGRRSGCCPGRPGLMACWAPGRPATAARRPVTTSAVRGQGAGSTRRHARPGTGSEPSAGTGSEPSVGTGAPIPLRLLPELDGADRSRPRRGAAAASRRSRSRRLRSTSRRQQQDRRAEQHLDPDGEGDGARLRTDLGEPARTDRPEASSAQQRGARGRQRGDAERDDRRAAPIGSSGSRRGASVRARRPSSADAGCGPQAGGVDARQQRGQRGAAGGVGCGIPLDRDAARARRRAATGGATRRERAIQPASAPSATGSSASSSSHGVVDSGSAPSTGMPGITPSWVPAGETAVPVADREARARRRTPCPRSRASAGRRAGRG